ncbi:hypothetical protein SMATCC274_40810 [Serratia marcescens]|nr:hypothetical protein SMATCC274_40810 [Serratia marcescens]
MGGCRVCQPNFSGGGRAIFSPLSLRMSGKTSGAKRSAALKRPTAPGDRPGAGCGEKWLAETKA